MEQKKEMLYIASPYSHRDPDVEADRLKQVDEITTNLLRWWSKYVVPFSPISYTARFQDKVKASFDWYEFDLHFLRRCDAVLVIKMDLWNISKGVQLEIEEARKARKEIIYVEPEKISDMLNQRYRGI